MSYPKPPKRKATSIDTLPAAACDWQALTEATLNAWHQQLHLHAGRQRVARARLCLGSAWAQAARGNGQLRALAERLARDGAPVEVLIVPRLQRPELRLGWVAWHAPPQAQTPGRTHLQRSAAAPAFAAATVATTPVAAAPVPNPTPSTRQAPGARIMSRNFFLDLFNPQAPADEPALPSAQPSLAPYGSRSAPSAGAQLSTALAQIAEQIADREVSELCELQDTMDCRFQLWTLTFHVSADNEATLRNLITLNQRDDGVAKTLVERAFAKADAARWLNTLRMKLEFKRSENFPREASEVLMVCGRDSVALPFSYTGQIEVVQAAADANRIMQATSDRRANAANAAAAQPAGTPAQSAFAPGPAHLNNPTNPASPPHPARPGLPAQAMPPSPTALPAAVPADELLLWAQLPGEHQLRRWSFKTGAVLVGAAEDATLCVNQHHVSGEHLELQADAQGQWQCSSGSSGSGAACPSFILIPNPGKVTLGSGNEPGNEAITADFRHRYAMGKTEVTVGQWKAFWNDNPRDYQPVKVSNSHCNWDDAQYAKDDRHPVRCVNAVDAERYALWFAKKYGDALGVRIARIEGDRRDIGLPTELEWEFAARGGRYARKYLWDDGASDAEKLQTRAIS